MKNLNEVINQILTKSFKMKGKYIPEADCEVNKIVICTKNADEYDFYNNEIEKIASLVSENPDDIIYKLHKPFRYNQYKFNMASIGKPGKNLVHKGYTELIINNPEIFKSVNKSHKLTKNVNAEGKELYELKSKDFDVKLYFLPKTTTKEDPQEKHKKGPKSIEKKKDTETNLESERNKRLQVMADFENYKKRVEEERALFGAITNISIIQGILEVTDDINLAFLDTDINQKRLTDALNLTKDKLLGIAKNAGIEKIEVKTGDKFDKELMEAVTTVPDKKNKDKVIAVISSAYKYSGKDVILKPAKVVVGK